MSHTAASRRAVLSDWRYGTVRPPEDRKTEVLQNRVERPSESSAAFNLRQTGRRNTCPPVSIHVYLPFSLSLCMHIPTRVERNRHTESEKRTTTAGTQRYPLVLITLLAYPSRVRTPRRETRSGYTYADTSTRGKSEFCSMLEECRRTCLATRYKYRRRGGGVDAGKRYVRATRDASWKSRKRRRSVSTGDMPGGGCAPENAAPGEYPSRGTGWRSLTF